MDIYESSLYLTSLSSNILAESVDIFLNDIFPGDNRSKIITNLIKIQASEKEAQTIITKDQKLISHEKNTYLSAAFDIYKHLKNVLEFIDKANRGLLTGDLNEELIFSIKNALEKYKLEIEEKNFDKNEEKRNKLISLIYDEISQTAFGLWLFKLPLKGIPHPESENPLNLFERQLLLEDESNEIAIEKFLTVYEDLQNFGLSYNLKFARKYIIDWFPNLTRAIKEEQDLCIAGDQKGDRKYYGPYLTKLSSEKLSLLALTELMKCILKLTQQRKDDKELEPQVTTHPYFVISKILFNGIGRAANAQLIFDYEEEILKLNERQRQKDTRKSSGSKEDEDLKKEVEEMIGKKPNLKPKVATQLLKKKLSNELFSNIGIPADIQIKIGSLMVYFMKETIKIKNEYGFWIPLVSPGYVRSNVNKNQHVGVLNVDETFLMNIMSKVDKNNSLFVQLDRCLPMIYKPAPWQDYEIGGYYQKPTNLMRMQESFMQENSVKYSDLHRIFNVLDLLSETPWRINKRILDIVEKIWEDGGGIGEIPKRFYNFDDYIYQYQIDESFGKEKYKLMKKMQIQRDIHSLRCDFILKLNVAKGFSGCSQIYFPNNLDFRGRVYPVPPHLNHIGADLSRGLLEFSEGKPIGPKGIYWLKIHLANKMGKDKLSFPERLSYVESLMGVIEQCVADPIKNRQWLEFEDSWQTLASMFELTTAMKHPKPEEHISHLHLHQDGSCNGLQHYAALGRDEEGAKQVNLAHNERPGDVYTHVANMISAKVEKDSLDPDSKYYKIANKLKGNIKRKIVKQTVMTSVYGVTFIGARKQIYKQLKDKDFMHDDERDAYEASYYIAMLTLDSIKDLFSGAHEIKKWLIQCAGLIAETKNPVSWITPFGYVLEMFYN